MSSDKQQDIIANMTHKVRSQDVSNDEIQEMDQRFRFITAANRTLFCANCWHASEYESDAMWSRYGHEAVAIQSTFSRLCQCLPHLLAPIINVGIVTYRDYKDVKDIDFTLDNFIAPLFWKRKSFDYEKEIRAVFGNAGVDDNRVPLINIQPTGIATPINVATLVENVHVAPGSPSWLRQTVQEIVCRFGYTISVKSSELDDRRLI